MTKDDDATDYSVTRDLTDWFSQHRDDFTVIGQGKIEPRPGQVVPVDPEKALSLFLELRARVDACIRHFSDTVRERYIALAKSHRSDESRLRGLLVRAGDDLEELMRDIEG